MAGWENTQHGYGLAEKGGEMQLAQVLKVIPRAPLVGADRKAATQRAIEVAMLGPAACEPAKGKKDDDLGAVQEIVDIVVAHSGCQANVGQAARILKTKGEAGKYLAARLQQGSRARSVAAHLLQGLPRAVADLLISQRR